MKQVDYARLFHEALSKAFAARSPKARIAYFELASFYREKLPDDAAAFPSAETLRHCREKLRGAGSAANG